MSTTLFTEFTDNSTALEPEYDVTTLSSMAPTGASQISCFIDAQLAFIVAASAGGVILILLTSTIALACNVSRLKRHHRQPRPSRSNADLVSGTGYWGNERREGGIVGPCETSVLLEEVKTDGEDEEVHDGEAGPSQYITTTKMTADSENIPTVMPSSASRDSCIGPINVEDMPLVV